MFRGIRPPPLIPAKEGIQEPAGWTTRYAFRGETIAHRRSPVAVDPAAEPKT